MVIDKTFGEWCDYGTELDDLAYYLCAKGFKDLEFDSVKHENIYAFITQDVFISEEQEYDTFKDYYEKAIIMLRKEKLKRIKEKLNDNR